jgi:hypothetical protein
MPTEAWLLEGASIGEGDEIANSLADRINTLDSATDKIDGAATDGLAGTSNSLAYRVHEIERHLHSWERWFGLSGAPSGETHRAQRVGTTSTAFQIDAGNNTWGSWLQVLGSSDTPAVTGQAKFDLHRIAVTAIERANAIHFVQLAFGTSGAVALAATTYTELVFEPTVVQGRVAPIDIITRRQDAGTKAWARCWVVGQNTGTVDFFIGLHEYEG